MSNTASATFWHNEMIAERKIAARRRVPDVPTLQRRIRILEEHELWLLQGNVSAQELSLVRIAAARMQNHLADRIDEMVTADFHL